MSKANNKSPCITCTRVADPENCAMFGCHAWRAWFIHRWNSMRASVFSDAQQYSVDSNAISVGGYKYSHPDHVRQFLKHKLCLDCDCPVDLCKKPCAILMEWEAMKERAVKK